MTGRLLAGVVGSIVAVSVLAIAFAASRSSGDEPGPAGAQPVPQSAAAEAAGVRLQLLDATFSGTETLARLDVIVNGKRADYAAVPPNSLDGATFGGSFVETLMFDGGTLLLRLPPVGSPGVTKFTLARLDLMADGRRWSAEGPWALELKGPSLDEFSDVMRVERLTTGSVEVDGTILTFSARRSTSRTILEYQIPPGWIELGPPQLVVGDNTRLPIQFGDTPSQRVAEFGSTPFGEILTVRPGTYAVRGSTTETVEILLGDAFSRAGVGSGAVGRTADISAAEVTGGRRDLVLSAGHVASTASWRSEPLLQFSVRGSWETAAGPAGNGDPSQGTPAVFDARGQWIRRFGVSTHYNKTADGTVVEGGTAIDVGPDSDTDLSKVTVVLGAPARIVRGSASATLTVAP